jgi:hypothetical protein
VAAFALFVAAIAAAVIWSEEIWNWIKKISSMFMRLTPLGILITGIGDAIIFVMEQFQLFSFDSLSGQITEFLAGAGGKVMAFFGLGTETSTSNETNVNIQISGKVDGAETSIKASRTDTQKQLKDGRAMAGAL